jgi:hypothetical protein
MTVHHMNLCKHLRVREHPIIHVLDHAIRVQSSSDCGRSVSACNKAHDFAVSTNLNPRFDSSHSRSPLGNAAQTALDLINMRE